MLTLFITIEDTLIFVIFIIAFAAAFSLMLIRYFLLALPCFCQRYLLMLYFDYYAAFRLLRHDAAAAATLLSC